MMGAEIPLSTMSISQESRVYQTKVAVGFSAMG